MNCRIIALDEFKRDAKKLIKKYASLKEELRQLQTELSENPRSGILIAENTYKIRVAVKSKGKGKSGGLRVLTHVIEIELTIDSSPVTPNTTVFLLTIYDKSERETISDNELRGLVEDAQNEIDSEDISPNLP